MANDEFAEDAWSYELRCLEGEESDGKIDIVSLAEIKSAVDELSPEEFTELIEFMRKRDEAAWDRQIDDDFSDDGRLRRVLDEVREDLHAGRVQELP